MHIINNMPITAVAAVVVLTVSAAALAAEDDMTADAIVNGVHGYMPDNYVVPKEPEACERLEWLKDQKPWGQAPQNRCKCDMSRDENATCPPKPRAAAEALLAKVVEACPDV